MKRFGMPPTCGKQRETPGITCNPFIYRGGGRKSTVWLFGYPDLPRPTKRDPRRLSSLRVRVETRLWIVRGVLHRSIAFTFLFSGFSFLFLFFVARSFLFIPATRDLPLLLSMAKKFTVVKQRVFFFFSSFLEGVFLRRLARSVYLDGTHRY